MKGIGIEEPCSENFAAMPKTELGAYCDRCRFEVIDFTQMSAPEIREALRARSSQKICGHITHVQMEDLNLGFENWRQQRVVLKRSLVIALLLVFGMNLFSCSAPEDRRAIYQWREKAMEWVAKTKPSCNVDPMADTTVTGQMMRLEEDIPSIEYHPAVDGGMVMDPEFIDYLEEE